MIESACKVDRKITFLLIEQLLDCEIERKHTALCYAMLLETRQTYVSNGGKK